MRKSQRVCVGRYLLAWGLLGKLVGSTMKSLAPVNLWGSALHVHMYEAPVSVLSWDGVVRMLCWLFLRVCGHKYMLGYKVLLASDRSGTVAEGASSW